MLAVACALSRLRALAITSEKRSALWPDLPAMAQTLPGYDVASRLAIFAPAGTPASIVKRLNEEIVRVLRRPDVKEKDQDGIRRYLNGLPAI